MSISPDKAHYLCVTDIDKRGESTIELKAVVWADGRYIVQFIESRDSFIACLFGVGLHDLVGGLVLIVGYAVQ